MFNWFKKKTEPITLEIAQKYYKNGDFAKSYETLRQLLTNDSGNTDYLHLAGWSLRMLGRHEEVIDLYLRVIEEYPDNLAIRGIRGETYYEMGVLSAAEADFLYVLSKDTSIPQCWYGLALIASDNNQLDKAIDLVSNCLLLAPNHEGALFLHGRILYSLGRYQEAYPHCMKAAEVLPENLSCVNLFADCRLALGLLDLSTVAILDQAIALGAYTAVNWYNKGYILHLLGDIQGAYSSYSTSIELDTDFYHARFQRAQLLRDGNYIEPALQDIEYLLRTNPNDTHALVQRALCLNKKGNVAAAIADLRSAVATEPNIHAYNNLGLILSETYLNEAKFQYEAIHLYNKALEMDASFAYAYCNRGVAYDRLGEVQEAIKNYTTAIDLLPSYITAYQNRSAAYRSIGAVKAAQADLETIARLDKISSPYRPT
jgi:tetratricopeptide (TPR) repeat protein